MNPPTLCRQTVRPKLKETPLSLRKWGLSASRAAWSPAKPEFLASSYYAVRRTHKRHNLLRAVQDEFSDTGFYSGETFYDILGVSSDADEREIKMAYYSIMRECHPDRSQDDESTEFCMMLNDIYDTLSDPSRRALYDELAGFSDQATNPFLDSSHERDLVFVDEFTCIGCRNCNSVCPKTFTMEEDWGRARVMRQRMDTDEKLQEAIDTCPVSCIHWVSAPQLSLLEAAMARMERVAVWSLMSGGGANRDVFTEASLAWEKRYAIARQRRESAEAAAMEAQRSAEDNGFWSGMRNGGAQYEGSTGSRFYEQVRGAQSRAANEPQSKDVRNIAALAARAARASRSWKVYQEVEKAKTSLQLAATVQSADVV